MPRTTTAHCSPFRPAFSVSSPALGHSAHQQSTDSSESPRPSPFSNVSTRLNSEQLDSYLRAEIRYLRRRKLIPQRNSGAGGASGTATSVAYRAPSSPNSSDSDGESGNHLDKSISNETRDKLASGKPQFTFKQVQMICDRLLKEQEARLRTDYEAILNTKLSEQYETFVKFTQDQIHRHIDHGTASYLS